MESLPREIWQHEIITKLDPPKLVNYCATSKSNARLCRSPSFWKLKVHGIPRREIQNDWFLFFSKEAETGLLSGLFDAITSEGVILDNRAITYAALYLTEKKDQLSASGRYLCDLLTARAETDEKLMNELAGAGNLRIFFEEVRVAVSKLRIATIKAAADQKRPPILSTELIDIESVYLGEYIGDYLYKQTKNILPELKSYYHRSMVKTETIFLNSLIGAMVRSNEIAKVAALFDYLRPEFFTDSMIKSYYVDFFRSVIDNTTLEKIPSISDYSMAFLWREKGNRWLDQNRVSRLTPVDAAVFFELIRLSPNDFIAHGYKALEPQVYLQYIDRLATEKKIATTKETVERDVVYYANNSGYTYTALVFAEALSNNK